MKSVSIFILCLTHSLVWGYGPETSIYGPCSYEGFCMCAGQEPGTLLPDCENCASYFYCDKDSIKRMECSCGQIFDVNEQACVPGKCPRLDGQCAKPTTIPNPTAPGSCPNAQVRCSFHGQIIAHAEHCRFFWTCGQHCPQLGFCELGQWFNREKFVCDSPQNVRNCPANRD